MKRPMLRRWLTWGLVAVLLLPVVIAVLAGLGGLLAALGDESGARGCGRAALVMGVAWLTAVVATVAATAAATLEPPAGRGRRRRRARRWIGENRPGETP